MRAPISVVIPTLNAAARLPMALDALSEGLTEGLVCELVISDGGSEDTTLALADAAGAHIVAGPASRGGQLRRGAEAARGDWFLFLHADTRLAPGWPGPVAAALDSPGARYFRLRFDVDSVPARLVAGWANLRARCFGLPYGDQGLLIDRESYAAAGGFADIPLMEDVAMARALSSIRALDHDAVTSAERYVRDGWLRRGRRNLTTLALYLMGRDPRDLVARYRR